MTGGTTPTPCGGMKAAVCGTLLMRGQEHGWLEPHLYGMVMSLIAR